MFKDGMISSKEIIAESELQKHNSWVEEQIKGMEAVNQISNMELKNKKKN